MASGVSEYTQIISGGQGLATEESAASPEAEPQAESPSLPPLKVAAIPKAPPAPKAPTVTAAALSPAKAAPKAKTSYLALVLVLSNLLLLAILLVVYFTLRR